MSLPVTLSKDLTLYLKNEGSNEDRIIEKLKKNPPFLLKFLEQASLSRSWFITNIQLAVKLTVVISKMISSDIITWDVVRKVMNHVVINNLKMHQDLYNHRTNYTNQYYSLILAANCPGERENWHTNNGTVCLKGTSFFSLHVFQDASIFYTCSYDDLLNSLNKCLLQKYEEGIEILERIVIARMHDFRRALSALSFAILNERIFLKEKSENYIQDYKFYLYVQDKRPVLSVIKIEPKNCEGLYPEYAEFCTDSYILLSDKEPKPEVKISTLQLYKDNDALIVFTKDYSSIFFNKLSKTTFIFSRKLVLSLDSKIDLTKFEILGLVAAYQLDSIEFDGYQFDLELLEMLSAIRPTLKNLYFFGILRVKNEILLAIPDLFTKLESLSLCNQNLNPDVLQVIFNVKNLKELQLIECIIHMPQTCPPLDHLKSLLIEKLTFKSGAADTILSQSNQLEKLYLNTPSSFDLQHYPYADHIYELEVNESYLRINEEKIEGLERFTSLKKIIVTGEIPDHLKKILSKIREEKKIEIVY